MSEEKPQVLLLGATGYIAGVLLSQWYRTGFSNLPFKVTASSRSQARLDRTAKLLGISTVTLSFDDTAGLEKEVQKYHIVVQLADFDAFEATHAILRGMKTRYRMTSIPPVLYHASGAGKLPSLPLDNEQEAGIHANIFFKHFLTDTQVERQARTTMSFQTLTWNISLKFHSRSLVCLPSFFSFTKSHETGCNC